MSVPLTAIAQRLAREALLSGARPAGEQLERISILDLTEDSRGVRPGSLFCAIRGTAGDGHEYLGAAAAAGAAAALVEHADPDLDLPQIEVADGRRAAAIAAAEFFGNPWDELALVGVTGTNGKTTTVWILRHLLDRDGAAASLGTLGVVGPGGDPLPGAGGLTTPGPVEIARLFRDLADRGVRAVAMEVSSHALQQARVAALRFNAAVFTNLTRDHLDYHGTFEEYHGAKLRLLDLLAVGGAAVVNADDPAWVSVEQRTARVVRFGTAPDAQVRAEDVVETETGMEWTLRAPEGAWPVRLPLLGGYNVLNALGAAAALRSLGWPLAEVAERLSSVPQVPGRLERLNVPAGAPAVVIDFAHTPDALQRALAALRPRVRGRLLVVFGAGGDRDRGKRPEMGAVAAAGADLTIVTTDNPRTEDPERIIDDIESGMGDARRLRVLDRREAISRAIEIGGADDLVLLAGKGHETYQIWGTELLPFDERQVVREILTGRESSS